MNSLRSGLVAVGLTLMLAGCDPQPRDEESERHSHYGDHSHSGDHSHAGSHGHSHDHSAAGGHRHDVAPRADSTEEHGHDHEDHLTLTRFSERLLVFIEYEPLVAGRRADFHVHLTDRASGGPVVSGGVMLRLTPEAGEATEVAAEQPDEPGIYDLSPRPRRPGAHRARLHLRSASWEETVELGEVVVYAEDEAARDALHDQPPESLDAISLSIEDQWEVRLHSEPVVRKTLVQRIDVPGRIEAAQGHAAVVAAPVEGRLVRRDDRALPRLGEHLEAGEVLGWVELTLSADRLAAWAADRAALQATRGEVVLRRLEVGRQATEARRALAEAEADLAFHRRASERAKQMARVGAGSEEQANRAERDAAAAEAHHAAAQESAELHTASHAELEELATALATSIGPGADASTLLPRVPLIAPIDGQVVEAPGVEGEQVSAGQPLYRLLNPQRVWVTARVGEFDLGRLSPTPSARVRLDDGSDRWLELSSEELVDLTAPVAAPDRTALLRYEIDNAAHQLRPGMSVTAWIETQRAADVVTVSEEAVLLDAGRPVVFVQTGGETFEKRRVELGVRDGPQVEIRAGVQPGEQVVTRGAATVKLAGQVPGEVGHGHVH